MTRKPNSEAEASEAAAALRRAIPSRKPPAPLGPTALQAAETGLPAPARRSEPEAPPRPRRGSRPGWRC